MTVRKTAVQKKITELLQVTAINSFKIVTRFMYSDYKSTTGKRVLENNSYLN